MKNTNKSILKKSKIIRKNNKYKLKKILKERSAYLYYKILTLDLFRKLRVDERNLRRVEENREEGTARKFTNLILVIFWNSNLKVFNLENLKLISEKLRKNESNNLSFKLF